MEDTTVLRPSRAKLLGYLAISVAFVAVGVWIISAGVSAWGWAAAAFFGLCALVFCALLLPGSAYLRIGPEGFTVRNLFRSYTLPWSAVERFEVGYVGQNRGIVFDFSADYQRRESGRRAAALTTGHEGALPDTYGMSPEALAELLNRYKSRYSDHPRPARYADDERTDR